MTSFHQSYSLNNREIPESERDIDFFSDCSIIKQLSDSSFSLSHSDGSSIILYRNIRTITFLKDKSKFWYGAWMGAAIGAGFGLLVSLTHENYNPDATNNKTNTLNAVAIGVPVCAFLGSITGGIIGALTKEKEIFDFKNYKPEQRKEKALNIFLKYTIK